MDSGTTIHVGNDLGRFTNIRPPMTGDFLWAGNTRVWIKAYGSVTLRVDSADGHRLLYLENVAYCPDLHCSLVSFRILRRQGLWWDTKSDPTILRRSDDSELAVLHEKYGQWILELNDAEARAAFSTQQPTRRTAVRKRAEAIVWHKRLGHPGSDALEHLVNQSEGVKIVGVPTVKCDACGISKSKRMIRRTPRTILEGPGERVAIDFHDYEAESTTKEKSQMLINCRVTGYIWDFYLSDNRTARVILKSLKMFVTFMMNQFGITVKVIETDNEIFSVKPEVARWCRTRGIVLEPSAPDTQAQNGGAERSGGVVKEKGRAMRLDAHLPWDQWPEIARTAVYLHNRTPKYQNRWRSPYEMFFTAIAFQNGVVTSPRKPNLSHLRAYGCKAFAMTDDTKRGKGRLQRFDPKAWIGYLVGYRSTNIFRIWVPSIGKVISTRDVVFDEEVVYSGEHKEVMDNLMHSTTEEIAAWIRTIELPPGPNPTREELGTFYEDETIARAPENGRLEYDEAGRKVVPYPTPPHTPPPAALLAQMLTNVEHPFRDDDTGGYGLQSEETAYGKQGLDTSYGEHGVQTGAQREHGLSAGVPREQCDAGGYGLQSEETAYGKQGLDTSYGEHGVQTGAQREHGLSAGVPREQCDAGGYGLQSEETAYGKQGLDTSYGKQGLASGILHPEHRMLKEPWAAAFMAGTKAGNVQNLAGERLDKAKLERMMRNGKKPHRSQLPPPPQANGLREDHELDCEVLAAITNKENQYIIEY
ncbi:GAG-pre-integrase domain containing protein [Pyrenophora tritici-repentis]|nr:GAG-pre-integrase domain containing protein [Pyrenophora tritici-repentis]